MNRRAGKEKGDRVEKEIEGIISRQMGGGNNKDSLLTGKETEDRWLKVGSPSKMPEKSL